MQLTQAGLAVTQSNRTHPFLAGRAGDLVDSRWSVAQQLGQRRKERGRDLGGSHKEENENGTEARTNQHDGLLGSGSGCIAHGTTKHTHQHESPKQGLNRKQAREYLRGSEQRTCVADVGRSSGQSTPLTNTVSGSKKRTPVSVIGICVRSTTTTSTFKQAARHGMERTKPAVGQRLVLPFAPVAGHPVTEEISGCSVGKFKVWKQQGKHAFMGQCHQARGDKLALTSVPTALPLPPIATTAPHSAQHSPHRIRGSRKPGKPSNGKGTGEDEVESERVGLRDAADCGR